MPTTRRKQQVVYHCDVCDCDIIKRSHKSKHERTYSHKEQLEKKDVKDASADALRSIRNATTVVSRASLDS